jgi:hypothetical protein
MGVTKNFIINQPYLILGDSNWVGFVIVLAIWGYAGWHVLIKFYACLMVVLSIGLISIKICFPY